ncbi:MAG: hypothetical protein OXL96_14015 [Candidatus Poribacteria bacterium]|nr:hypothetical protein [Candidatus Poribacteria bacterium]
MHQISLQEAVKMTGKSESTLRRAIKAGKVSATRDDRNHFQFDVAELQRAYGKLLTTGDDAQSTPPAELALPMHDPSREIELLEHNLADLRHQLERTEAQLDIANSEKAAILDMLSAEKEERRALMPPPKERKRNWFAALFSLPITQKNP